jgi:hypothetical protein
MGDRTWARVTIHVPATGCKHGMAAIVGGATDLHEAVRASAEAMAILSKGGSITILHEEAERGDVDGLTTAEWAAMFEGLDLDHYRNAGHTYDAAAWFYRRGQPVQEYLTIQAEGALTHKFLKLMLREGKTLQDAVAEARYPRRSYTVPRRKVYIQV